MILCYTGTAAVCSSRRTGLHPHPTQQLAITIITRCYGSPIS